jgi:hypothetical protein
MRKSKKDQKQEITEVVKDVSPESRNYVNGISESIQSDNKDKHLNELEIVAEAIDLKDYANSVSSSNESVVTVTQILSEEIDSPDEPKKILVNKSDLESSGATLDPQKTDSEIIPLKLTSEEEINLLIDENKLHKKRLAEIKSTLQEKDLALGEIETKIEFLKTSHENLSEWYQDKSDSFAARFIFRLNEAKLRLENDEFSIRKWLSTGVQLDTSFVKKVRNWFVKRFLVSLLFMGLGILTTYLINRYYKNDVISALNQISMSITNIYFIILSIYIIYLSGLIFNYSRKWSKHRRELSIASSQAVAMLSSLEYIRQARLRIDSLHPQMEQYLQILSAAIHAPWKVPDDLLNFKSSETQTNFLPEGVDIAAPFLGMKDNKFNVLVNKTVSRLFTNGWRREAFDNLISKMSENAGVSVSIGELDRDARRNGLRSLYLKLHSESYAGDNEILVEAAKDRIKLVVPIVQREILTQFQPPVSSVKDDPLNGLELGEDLVDTPENYYQWDDFLTNIAGPSSPWSPLVFSNEGILRGRQEKINRSFILGSSRLSKNDIDSVEFIETTSNSTRPVDLLLRVDLSHWCSAGEVKVFEGMPVSEIESNLEVFENDNYPSSGLGAI